MKSEPFTIRSLAIGNPATLSGWLDDSDFQKIAWSTVVIVLGTGLYGATIGIWNSPRLALYVGIKLPLIIFATLILNGVINGMLAQVLGGGLSFRQTLQALLMSFAVFALITGSLAPVLLFLISNAPASDSAEAAGTHQALLLLHTALIAFAGVVATQKLFGFLAEFTDHRGIARRTLFAWLAGNLFVGAQVGFLFRPILGTPGLKIEILRPDPFEGNFYESVWWALTRLLSN